MIPSKRPPSNSHKLPISISLPRSWSPPRVETQPNIHNANPIAPNPYHDEWIKEWKNALSKSAYPLWEEWFRQRDWQCLGHLSVNQPAWFKKSIHIGDIDLQHQLTVKGSTRLNGDLHIFGKIWHHPSQINEKGEWELQTPTEAYSWNEIIQKQNIQLQPIDGIGCWTTWNQQTQIGIGLIQNTNEQKISLISWKNHIDHSLAEQLPNLKLDIPQIETQTLQTQQLLLSGPITSSLPTQFTSPQLSIHAPLVLHHSLQIKDYVHIDDEGHVFFRGKDFNCTSLMRAEQIISYDTFTCPRVIIDEWIETRNVRIQDSLTVNQSIRSETADINHLHIHGSFQVSSNQIIKNLNAELWENHPYPNTKQIGEFLHELLPQNIANKTLISPLNANHHSIIHLPEPTQPHEPATKEYVDRQKVPWKMFGDVQQWIPYSQARKWGKYKTENHIWIGQFHKGIDESWKVLKSGDIVGVYLDQNNQDTNWHDFGNGLGIFQILEHGDSTNFNEPGKLYDFTWTIHTPFYQWITSNIEESIWVGGPEGTLGGAKLIVIQSKRNQNKIQLQFNILMSWHGIQTNIHLRIKKLEELLHV